MSGAARRRGAGRARDEQSASESTSSTPLPLRGPRRGTPSQGQVPAGGFDGPASRGSASGGGSRGQAAPNAPSVGSAPSQGGPAQQTAQTGSRRSSVALVPTIPAQAQEERVRPRDPAKDPNKKEEKYMDQFRNLDLPGEAFNFNEDFKLPTAFQSRRGYNNTGIAIQFAVNAYRVVGFPSIPVYQYDVIIGDGTATRGLQRKVWESKTRKDATGPEVLWDGNRLAWSLKDFGQVTKQVDLDAEQGRPSRPDRPNIHRVQLSRTKRIDIGHLESYINGKIQMDNSIIEIISFFDHLLRESSHKNSEIVTQKRSLFSRNAERADLGGGIEVYRGVYQSLRLAENRRLIINLDVANTTFWKPQSLLTAILAKWGHRDPNHLASEIKVLRQQDGSRKQSMTSLAIQRAFKTLLVKAVYKGNPAVDKEWRIKGFTLDNANEHEIDWKDPVTKKKTGEMITIAQYFFRKYNLRIQFPQLPLVEMTKKGVFYPLEYLHLLQCQRFGAKLDETQTANMIKFAVSPPSTRLNAIGKGKAMLNWQGDVYLKNYGLRVNNDSIITNARVLPAPAIEFGARKRENPGTSGRWRLLNTKFYAPNSKPLKSWGVGVFTRGNFPPKEAIEKFANDFMRSYRNHGGNIESPVPFMMNLPPDPADAVEKLFTGTGNKFQMRPQLLIFLVQDKGSFHYLRLKKSCDCRYGVVSQVMQVAQVMKGQPQYYSNVLMKVNAKLGGTTSKVVPNPKSGFTGFGGPTMIIGADVSHPSPGSPLASTAAITVSQDMFGGRYMAAVQTNGARHEMVTEANWHGMLQPLAKSWFQNLNRGQPPQHVYYIRDGVSEGQYAHVLNQEVPHLKAALTKVNNDVPWSGKLTVIIASKRHHVRAFPKGGDKNAGDNKGNPLPGVLIERDVTSADEFDFYLYSHIALQGTSRPVHYTILYDDAGLSPNHVQNMLYEHCYQYMRSTTSVSLHPAVYYAHLASNRGGAHIDFPATAGPQGGAGYKQNISDSGQPNSEANPLIPLEGAQGIRFAMWYI